MDDRLDDAELAAWTAYVVASLNVLARIDRDLKAAADISHLDFGILSLLSFTSDGQRGMTELARTFGVDPATITYRVRRLESRRLVERVGSAADGRAVLAKITPDGESLLGEVWPVHVAGIRRYFLNHVERDELPTVARTFGRMRKAQERPAP